ncbi:MAG: MBL fold metallo-hydrolase [Clostridia bacterium]|nr:MBL fold metallo-hydrolase [Clostridia bacterium]
MSVQTIIGPFSTNTYIVCSKDTSVVIDPSGDGESIYRRATAEGRVLAAILLTHGHFDHMDALAGLVSLSGAPVYISSFDFPMLSDPYLNASWLVGRCISASVNDVRLLSGGERLVFSDLSFLVYATPGHSEGSLCYLWEDNLFSGDTVFADGYGRTDLAGAKPELYASSLASIRPLIKTKNLYPGHGRIIIRNHN